MGDKMMARKARWSMRRYRISVIMFDLLGRKRGCSGRGKGDWGCG